MADEDHEQLANKLAEESDKLKIEGERLEEKIDGVRSDWRRKQQDAGVPGANPPENEDSASRSDG